MKHEISITYEESTGNVELKLDGEVIKLAKALRDSVINDPQGKFFLADLAVIVGFAKEKVIEQIKEANSLKTHPANQG